MTDSLACTSTQWPSAPISTTRVKPFADAAPGRLNATTARSTSRRAVTG